MSELDQYQYDLPKELIAQEPLSQRADARLLVVNRADQTLAHHHVRDLPEILRSGDLLITNDTRVVPARLVGRRTDTGGHWEGLFLSADNAGLWKLLCRTRGKLAPGEMITLVDRDARDALQLRLIEKDAEGAWIVRPLATGEAWSLLEKVGRVPLPHYIRAGEMVDADQQRYQTVFARRPGAVAAPTAGLHFTDELLRRLQAARVEHGQVTLHVGMDTFRPITSESLAAHPMHSEWGELTSETAEQIRNCRARHGRMVAVGTTTVRVLETAAAVTGLQAWSGETRLFIRPPYQFQAIDALLTNFHLPRTTLLVLVRTFGGDELMRRAYEEAIREQYRFYSYGDAMLIC